MIETVKALLQGGDGVAYECRRCGTSVDAASGECPSCGSSEIAEYAIR